MIDAMENQYELHEISVVGDLGKYEIYVNTGDVGKVPHVHFQLKKGGNIFHTCILLLEADYFFHGESEDVLDYEQKKVFQIFMESPVTIPKYESKFNNNWELACCMWDINNTDVLIPDDAVMPNYGNLPNK